MLSGLGLAGGASFAAEFEVLDKLTADGYTMLHTSATINGTGVTGANPIFTVASSTFNILANGNVGIGTTDPAGLFQVGGGSLTVLNSGKVGVGTTNPVADFEVAGEIKLSYSASSCTLNTAGTLRWYDGHISVCNGTNWRQLDNQAPPTITTISPDNGPVSGGTEITITGTGFVAGPAILIGGVTATAITVVSVTQITATTPASGTTGSKVVKITNPDGQYITGEFIYNPLPTLSPVSPNNGRITGGNAVTITGTNFVSGVTVKIDNVSASNVAFISAAELHAATPAGSSTGAKDVRVTNPDGGFILLPGGFTYNALPTITSPVNPDNGRVTGGNAITINGSGFVSGAAVTIGGSPATGLSITAGQITATTPAGSIGAQTVTVTNPDGGSAALTGGFTYNALPTVTGVSPASGPQGTVITIEGTGFISGAGLGITIGGAAATGVTWLSAAQIRATTPASAASGAKAVRVTNPDGGYGELAGSFTYTVYATGGTVIGSYRIHTFTSGGSITFDTGGNVEVLVVAGGGGGGGGFQSPGGGGGGAGGLIYSAAYSVTAGQAITVTVGAGGAGGIGDTPSPSYVRAASGSNSVFGTLTATGGGGGGVYNGIPGQDGGSGGGGSYGSAPGSGIAGQGNNGGVSVTEPSQNSGGGGGAGAVGGTPSSVIKTVSGLGGVGLSYSISGTPAYYAGGGSAGQGYSNDTENPNPKTPGSLGGGGTGGRNVNPDLAGGNGSANTGGGGGGAGGIISNQVTASGGSGGSGIVIVRYPIAAALTVPTITAVSPASGPQGTVITITGTGFADNVSVTIGTVEAAVITRDSATQIRATAPAASTAGVRDVTVTNLPDKSYAVKAGCFIYTVYAAGGTEYDSGAYRIHTFDFVGSNTFQVNTGGNVEIYVWGAGGGGGNGDSSGGSGGYAYGQLSAAETSYTVIVGGGGTAGASQGGGGGGGLSGLFSGGSALTFDSSGKSRAIIIAGGGGGGSGGAGSNAMGGAGGGDTGNTGYQDYRNSGLQNGGGGGGQTAGGAAAPDTGGGLGNGTAGSQLQGGTAAALAGTSAQGGYGGGGDGKNQYSGSYGGGGGGGGYWGGGGGQDYYSSAGGGGSGYIGVVSGGISTTGTDANKTSSNPPPQTGNAYYTAGRGVGGYGAAGGAGLVIIRYLR